MKTSSFLTDELRAIRGVSSDRLFLKRPRQQEPPPGWQDEIERVQNTLKDVIRAVCRLSGIELPGPDSDGTDGQILLPLAEGESFKDRIRTDLESFSATTASELLQQAQEQTRAAMGRLQNEFKVRVELLSRQLREGLQEQFRPEQVQVGISQQTRDRVVEMVEAQTDDFARWVWLCCKGKGRPVASEMEALLEPYSLEAADKILASFGEQMQGVIAEQRRTLEEKLQGNGNFIGEQLESLREVSRQALEQDAEKVRNQSAEQLSTLSDELLKGITDRVPPELEGILGAFKARLAEATGAAQETVQHEYDCQEEVFRQRLESVASEVKEKSAAEVADTIEETTANAIGPSVEHLHHQANDSLEHSREEIKSFMGLQAEEVRLQIEEMGVTAHEALMKDTAQAVENLQGLEEEIAAAREKQMAISQEQLTSGVMECLDSMTERIRQITSERMEEVNRYVRETQESSAGQYTARLQQATENCLHDIVGRIWREAGEAGAQASEEFKVNSMSVIEALSEKVDASREALRRETAEATTRMESALQVSLESYRQKLAEVDKDGLKQQERVLKGSLKDLRDRLMQAASLLVPQECETQQPDVADAIVEA